MNLFSKIFLLIVFSISIIVAQPPIPDPNGRWVVDDAGVLSEGTKNTVSTLCQKEFDSTSNQVVVYLFNSLEGATIEGYANEVFNKWKIGSKKENNGILLIIAVKDHKMRIEVGYGLEAYLTDLECSTILDDFIRPRFKDGDFDGGITKGVEKIIEGIKGNLPVRNQSEVNVGPMPTSQYALGYFILAILSLFLFSVFGLVFSRIKDNKKAWRNLLISQAVFAYFNFTINIHWFTIVFGILAMGGMLVGFWKIRKYWKAKFGDDDKKWIVFNSAGGGGMFFGTKFTSSGGGGIGGGGGGGFSGGGGSSGGGGASGSW